MISSTNTASRDRADSAASQPQQQSPAATPSSPFQRFFGSIFTAVAPSSTTTAKVSDEPKTKASATPTAATTTITSSSGGPNPPSSTDAASPSGGRHLVVGVDTSACSANALKHTLNTTARPGDVVHVTYCYPPLADFVGPEFSRTFVDAESKSWRERQATAFQDFLQQHRFEPQPGVTLETHFIEGDPRVKLPQLATKAQASHIVIGTQERSSLSRAILGSVSADLTHRSSVPVTVVPHSPASESPK